MTDHVLALVTAPDADVARTLARAIVEERLAACVSLVDGVTSIYRWEGKTEEAREVQLLIKTRADRLDALTARVAELHPYDVPEVIATPILGGLAPYLAWIDDSVRPDAG